MHEIITQVFRVTLTRNEDDGDVVGLSEID